MVAVDDAVAVPLEEDKKGIVDVRLSSASAVTVSENVEATAAVVTSKMEAHN